MKFLRTLVNKTPKTTQIDYFKKLGLLGGAAATTFVATQEVAKFEANNPVEKTPTEPRFTIPF